jgi:endogenous inhibitor of DNA gyrase (YacG/DUF329 family)
MIQVRCEYCDKFFETDDEDEPYCSDSCYHQDGERFEDWGDDCTPSFEGGYWSDPNDPTA